MIQYILYPLPSLYTLTYNGDSLNPWFFIFLCGLNILIYFFILKQINQYYKNALIFIISIFVFLFILIYNLIIMFLIPFL